MLTHSEYVFRMMEIQKGVSLIETLIAYKKCKAPLKPKCLFGRSDKLENIKFAKVALLDEQKKFFNRYAIDKQQDFIVQLCRSVKRKLDCNDDVNILKLRKVEEPGRKRKLEKSRETCDQNSKLSCLVNSEKFHMLESDPSRTQTHITDFWQIKRSKISSAKEKTSVKTGGNVKLRMEQIRT